VIDFSPIVLFGILLVRIGLVVATTPVFGGTWAPMQVKVGLTAILALLMMPFVAVPTIGSGGELALIVAHEAVIGLALSFGIRVLVAAAELGGYLIGFQIGFSYAGIIDPQSGVRNNVLAVMYGTLTLLAIFANNLHHQLIRLMASTYVAVPVTASANVNESMVGTVMKMFGTIFTLGAQFAAPVVLVLLLVEVVMGVVTRAAPSLNLMIIGAPIRLLVGLFALGGAIQVIPSLINRTAGWSLELAAQLAHSFR
jgi:flagellar biosynthetic protein FliR